MEIDVLAFAAHPDDADISCGGLLLKLKDIGYKTGIIDLTEAELSSNGNEKTRKKETIEASKLLKLDIRENLDLGDCNVKNDPESRLKVINIIRKYKPKLAITAYPHDRHPDHENAGRLLKDSIFISGLKKFKTGLECHRPKIVINYMLNYQFKPSFIIDISKYHPAKMKAFLAFKSQFYRDYEKDVPTFINSKYFFDLITSRDKCYGLKIKAEYGEPYFIDSDLRIDDPLKFFDYLI